MFVYIYIYTSLPGQLPGYNCNKKPFLGYNCNKKLYTAQGRLNPDITAQIWKLLLITTKVSNHTKAHTYKCSNLQSASTLGGPTKHRKGEYFPPSCCNQCTQASNVQRSAAELDKPCTRPAQCTNEKQQARALISTQGHSKSLQQWERTVSRRTESRVASAKNPRRPRTSQKPQSLNWPLRVLLQWLNVRQKLHSPCEFNKTWQPLFRAVVLGEARLSNKSLDALRRSIYHLYHGASVYMNFRRTRPRTLRALGSRASKIHIHLSAMV